MKIPRTLLFSVGVFLAPHGCGGEPVAENPAPAQPVVVTGSTGVGSASGGGPGSGGAPARGDSDTALQDPVESRLMSGAGSGMGVGAGSGSASGSARSIY
jgi:hypothetical protein